MHGSITWQLSPYQAYNRLPHSSSCNRHSETKQPVSTVGLSSRSTILASRQVKQINDARTKLHHWITSAYGPPEFWAVYRGHNLDVNAVINRSLRGHGQNLRHSNPRRFRCDRLARCRT